MEAAHRAGTARPSVEKEGVCCISLRRCNFLSGNGTTKPRNAAGWRSLHLAREPALPPGGHSPRDQVPAWQTPLLAVPGLGRAPATREKPLRIPALHPCPQGILAPSGSPHTPPRHGSLAVCSALVSSRTFFITYSWDAPGPVGCCSSPLQILCGCLIINNESFQPHYDVGSCRRACSPLGPPYGA